MRKAFVKALCEIASKNKRIFLLTGDLGFNILEQFRDTYPDRFLNIGVAEANLITVAAGLSTTGYIPFVYSIATFATMRPFEQIRNDISLQNLNVKIIGVGGGLAYTKAGPTHHAMEDIGLMRLLPNMSVIVPSDPEQVYLATHAITEHVGPVYVRFERNPDGKVINSTKIFEIGKGIKIKSGKDLAILTTGAKLYQAIVVSEMLKKDGINASIFSFPTVKPLDEKLILQIAKSYKVIATLEEHAYQSGFGTAVLEYINQQLFRKSPKIINLGLKPEFTSISGDYETLMRYHHLLPEQITRKLKSIVKKS